MRRLLALGTVLFLTAIPCVSVLPATGTAEISGKVLDPKGAAVAGTSTQFGNFSGAPGGPPPPPHKGAISVQRDVPRADQPTTAALRALHTNYSPFTAH